VWRRHRKMLEYVNTWWIYAQTVHICLALAVTFCPTIGGMSHPQRREVAWCLCLHGLFTWSRVNAHFPRRFTETSQSFSSN